jgi:uncharacterized membrane protein YeaQ/YmgE (transglycosylase-associated protein family)
MAAHTNEGETPVLGFILFLIIGGIAGWLAGNIMRGGGFGIPINIALGVVGALVGGFLLSILGFQAAGLIAQLITATIGAVVVLAIAGALKKT